MSKIYMDALDYVMEHAEIEMSGRYKRKAGVAQFQINKYCGKIYYIRMIFSEIIFERFTEADRQDTVSHEMAHLIEAVVHYASNHGVRWQHIHRSMGGNGERFCKLANKEGLFNRVKRIKMFDTSNNKEYLVTTGKWFMYSTKYPQRFKRLSTVIMAGNKIVSENAA